MTWKSIVFSVFVLLEACSTSGVPTVTLNDGHHMPGFGFGTWLGFQNDLQTLQTVKDDSVQKAVEAAIDTGYRHIDTAAIYDTEDQVGRAINNKISEGVVKREDLFVTTKLWNDHHARSDVVPALRESLSKLNLEYIDLYLIHWPMAQFKNGSFQDIDYLETWQGMMDAKNLGLTKSIGVSNFNQQMLERIIKESGVKPAVLQIETNLNLQQPLLHQYCKEQQIAIVGYTPFGSVFRSKPDSPPPRADNPTLISIAEKHNKTVAQVVLRYLVDIGVTPIPKTVNKSRVEENFNIFDFELTDSEKTVLRGFDKQYRFIDIPFWKDSPYYPFEKK
ncbi:aldo-keto reductase AKR2E4-like [Epargyreus clarus]|uniref:aldo-keto reductase AKR2E4-like n=1 Tax=Epargyreus clarus TaxID=520877 RepID=UPI003C30E1A1